MNESEDPADVAQQLLLFHATDLVHHLVAKWKNYNENNTSFNNPVLLVFKINNNKKRVCLLNVTYRFFLHNTFYVYILWK